MKYVTYDPQTGLLTGAFIQELRAEHAAHYLEVTDEEYAGWLGLKMNTERTGTEAYTPPPAPPVVPDQVRLDQAQLALLDAGLLDAVEDAIENIFDPELQRRARISWTAAPFVRRHSDTTLMLAQMLSLSSEQIDALFVAAEAY